MVSPDILSQIRQIEITTRRLLNGALVGDSRSAVKGSGLEFDQIREYQLGDDVRFIDWKSSARMNKILIKQYIEERNRTIILAVDVSRSGIFSSSFKTRAHVIANIASVLALTADYGKDHVGLLLFAHDVELFIPPGSGKGHVRMLMEKVFTHVCTAKATRVSAALDYLARLKKRDALVVVISDFISDDFSQSLKLLAHKYELIALRCLDDNEHELPSIGFLTVRDSETGTMCTLNAGSAAVQKFLGARLADQEGLFKRCGVDILDVALHKPFVKDLIHFFRQRMRY